MLNDTEEIVLVWDHRVHMYDTEWYVSELGAGLWNLSPKKLQDGDIILAMFCFRLLVCRGCPS